VSIFITYAREDEEAVDLLRKDLTRMHRDVWIDEMLLGGQQWWDVILEQIRSCDIYIFALSENSLRSKPCRAELAYAEQLSRVIVPVKVGEVDYSLAPAVISNAQVLDIRLRTADSVLALREVVDAQRPAPPLPDPLPQPPAVPQSYLNALADAVDTTELSFNQQVWLVGQLRAHLSGDDKARATSIDLLQRLQRRADLSQQVAADVDAILRTSTARRPSKGGPWAPPHVGSAPAPTRGMSHSRRSVIAAAAIAGSIVLIAGVVLAVSRSGGSASGNTTAPVRTSPSATLSTTAPTTSPPTTVPTTLPRPTTIPTTLPTADTGPTADELQATLLTADEIGGKDAGPATAWFYPCSTTRVFDGFNALVGEMLDFQNLVIGTSVLAFTTDDGAAEFMSKLSQNGCNYLKHANGEVERTAAPVSGDYNGADVETYVSTYSDGSDTTLLVLDTFVQSGRAVGFVTCTSTTDVNTKALLNACVPIVDAFANNLNHLPD
jgi:TIR domain